MTNNPQTDPVPEQLAEGASFQGMRLDATVLTRAAETASQDGAAEAVTTRRSGADPGTFEFVASTDAPVPTGDRLVRLLHAPNNVRMSRANGGPMPLLWAHDRWDADSHLGTVDSARLENGKLIVSGRFSRNPRAQEKRQDYDDGIIRHASVGMVIHSVQRVADTTVAGKTMPTYEATDWEPREVSLATVPADEDAVSTRSASRPSTIVIDTREAEKIQPRQEIIVETNKDAAQELQRVQDILSVAGDKDFSKYISHEEVQRAVNDGTTSLAFRDLVARRIIEKNEASRVGTAGDNLFGELSRTDQKQYSLTRAMRGYLNTVRPGSFSGRAAECTLEREVSDELQKRTGVTSSGFLIPEAALMTRALGTAAVAGGAGQIALTSASAAVQTTTESNVIQLLRNRPRCVQLGARTLGGLQGNYRFPAQTGAGTWQWVDEGGTVNPADLTLSFIPAKPRRGSAQSGVTIEMVASESPDMEALILADFNAIRNIGLDLAALTGPPNGPGPVGVLNTSGVQIVTPSGTASKYNVSGQTTNIAFLLSYQDVLNFDTLVAEANADSSTCAWMVTPGVRAALKNTPMFPGATAFSPIWDNSSIDPLGITPGPLGYRAGVTNQLPSNGTLANYTGPGLHTAIFGDFSKMLFCDWGVAEVIYDPYTQAASGNTVMTVRSLHDVVIRHAVAFAAATTVAVA